MAIGPVPYFVGGPIDRRSSDVYTYVYTKGAAVMLTNIRAWGNSQGLCIPRDMLNTLGMGARDRVEISVQDGGIFIKPYKPLDDKKQAAINLKSVRKKIADIDYREEMNSYLDERYLHE